MIHFPPLTVPLAACLICLSCVNPCENKQVNEVWSPSRTKRAIIFERSCGATTAFIENVSVLWAAETLRDDEAGNIFSADNNHGAAENMRIKVEWNSEEQLLVASPRNARIFLQVSRLGSTYIRYQTTEK